MRLIDADALLVVPNINWVYEADEVGEYVSYMAVPVAAIVAAPTVEVATHVIRCKDCQAWGRSPWGHPVLGWCVIQCHHRVPDYFCASAKKRGSVEVKVNDS